MIFNVLLLAAEQHNLRLCSSCLWKMYSRAANARMVTSFHSRHSSWHSTPEECFHRNDEGGRTNGKALLKWGLSFGKLNGAFTQSIKRPIHKCWESIIRSASGVVMRRIPSHIWAFFHNEWFSQVNYSNFHTFIHSFHSFRHPLYVSLRLLTPCLATYRMCCLLLMGRRRRMGKWTAFQSIQPYHLGCE